MIIVYIAAAIISVMVAAVVIQAKIYARAGSIYYKKGIKEKLMAEYDRQLAAFPIPFKERYVQSKFGKVHVVECGNQTGDALVMFHAASVGAVSWKNNVEELGKTHHIFLIDTLGEGNRSELEDVEDYPRTSKEVADLYKDVTEQLGIQRATVAGASYGGFICLNYAFHYPGRVDKIILSGPMGVAKSVMKVILKLTFYSFYPYAVFRRSMAKWAFGNGPGLEDATRYFHIILEGVLGRYYAPKTLEVEVLRSIKAPVLLVLGKRDSLVGDTKKAAEYAANIPNLTIKTLNSGHLINVERSGEFNQLLLEYV
ncbi:MAG: alpha/beta hydrolase [Clostridiales bacterium]|nr:alpha/beta hydrolase [Clostridiales bacterium]